MNDITSKLAASFDKVEECLVFARRIADQLEICPPSLRCRIDGYDAMLAKQRALTETLNERFQAEDWDEVSRQVRIIQGISKMMRQDAYELLSELSLADGQEAEEGEAKTQYVC